MVWLSVPTTVSVYAVPLASTNTLRARNSRFTWWQMPVPGGTTWKLLNAFCPHRRKMYRSSFRWYSRSTLSTNAFAVPYSSTWTEWSMTSSTGTSGLIFDGSPPSDFMASRMAARSTTHGTPVKSCMSTRAGVNAISTFGSAFGCHMASASMSAFRTARLTPSLRRRFSSSTLSAYGSFLACG